MIIHTQKQIKMENLTGTEKVLYKTTYEFYLNVVKVSQEDAETQAKLKIEKKRKLAKVLPRI
jgi:hypothetical protein